MPFCFVCLQCTLSQRPSADVFCVTLVVMVCVCAWLYCLSGCQVGLLGAQVMTLRLLEQEGKKVTVVAACEKEADAARGTAVCALFEQNKCSLCCWGLRDAMPFSSHPAFQFFATFSQLQSLYLITSLNSLNLTEFFFPSPCLSRLVSYRV
jgi:hypothetical protein